MNVNALARFMRFVQIDAATGCWIWTGTRSRNGYGGFWLDGRFRSAHRVSFEHFVGEVPKGLEVDHLCRVRACVNPEHLEAVTSGENKRRSPLVGRHLREPENVPFCALQNMLKKQCPEGRQLSGDNLYVRPDGTRGCKECRRAAWRRWNERRRVEATA